MGLSPRLERSRATISPRHSVARRAQLERAGESVSMNDMSFSDRDSGAARRQQPQPHGRHAPERVMRPRQGTSPTLLFIIGALLIAVIVADLTVPLGLAVWVFYMLPLGACLYSWSPLLPLQVALLITASVALLVAKPLGGEAVT